MAHPWPQVFFLGKLLPTPTHLLPFFVPTHLPPSSCWPPPHTAPFALTSIAKAFDIESLSSFWPRVSLSSPELQECEIHRSFKGWELQECPNKRSFNVVVARVRKQEELQGGGKWEFESKLPSPPPYFLHFFGCEEDDNDAIVIFFCLFLLWRRRRQWWMFWDFPIRPYLLQKIKLKIVANKNFVLQNLNENQNFLLQTVLNFYFQE